MGFRRPSPIQEVGKRLGPCLTGQHLFQEIIQRCLRSLILSDPIRDVSSSAFGSCGPGIHPAGIFLHTERGIQRQGDGDPVKALQVDRMGSPGHPMKVSQQEVPVAPERARLRRIRQLSKQRSPLLPEPHAQVCDSGHKSGGEEQGRSVMAGCLRRPGRLRKALGSEGFHPPEQ
jgi:hypothetical protein